MHSEKSITVFEHEKITIQSHKKLDRKALSQLQRYHGSKGTPYFTLIHKGVKFNQFVGVIQVGNLTIEVLPKVDKTEKREKAIWRAVLIQMLRITSGIEAAATSKSDLRLHANSIFDLYIELFIKECEKLTHAGLVKKYRKVKENQLALKGRLHIPSQIRDNIIHKERFSVEYSKYDHNHLINQILKQTLSVLTQIPIRFDLRSRVKRQLLYFDEISGCAVNGTVFNQVVLNRKSDRYREALDIAKLILLNYHPDISKGATHVLALMFDMNKLWEGFITSMMKKYLSDNFKVKSQNSKIFWYSERGRKRLKPDILLIPKQDSSEPIIVDTKWKAPSRLRPSDTDLRQIFAYNQLFNSKRGMLLYPGSRNSTIGTFKTEEGGTCGMHFVDVLDEVGNLLTDKSMLKQILQT